MTDKNDFGVTVFSHESKNRTQVEGFKGSGSFYLHVTYHETSLLQLAILTALSSRGELFIMERAMPHHSYFLEWAA